MIYICRCTQFGVIDNDIENVWAHSFYFIYLFDLWTSDPDCLVRAFFIEDMGKMMETRDN